MNKYRQTKTSFNQSNSFFKQKKKNSNIIKTKTIAIILSSIIIIALIGYIFYLRNNPITKEVEKEVIVETIVTVEVEKIVTSEVYITVEPEPFYKVTDVEREMLARLVYREAGDSSLECQKMVISVVFNRYIAANGTMTLEEIIYQPGQFTPAPLIYKTTPTELNYQAVDEVIMYGSILPYYIRFFRADYHFDWNGYVGYTDLDGTYFGYLTKDI